MRDDDPYRAGHRAGHTGDGYDPDLRRRMGEQARATVAESYAATVVVPRLASILKAAAES